MYEMIIAVINFHYIRGEVNFLLIPDGRTSKLNGTPAVPQNDANA